MRGSHIGTAVALALFLAPAVASAGTLVFNFNLASGYTGFLDINYSGSLSGTGTLVTSITGDVDGDTNVALGALNGPLGNDNLVYSGPAYFDLRGVAFTFGEGQELALFGNTGAGKHPFDDPYGNPGGWDGALLCTNSSCLPNNSMVGGTVGNVPEPATWALMLAGFAGLGVAMRASRRRMAVARA
jgi:hypothetical protein